MLDICIYQDVLCPWCFVLEERLEVLRRELGTWASWRSRPFPLWLKQAALTEKEIKSALSEVDRAKAEPEGLVLSAELWRTQPPRSSVPALVAIEAAKLQGNEKMNELVRSMKNAALIQGVDITVADTALELASRAGLDMNRFTAAFQSESLKKLVLEEHRMAKGRGVKGVPTLVVNGRWMISGLRELSEYRELLYDCLKKSMDKKGGGDAPLLH
jgi:predicted DsbA family dithiol-disulfide isomerase